VYPSLLQSGPVQERPHQGFANWITGGGKMESVPLDKDPTFNTSRAETLASLDRFKKIAANLKATMILQHDGRDIGKLPAFPAAAR
jgi:hypothetical protein